MADTPLKVVRRELGYKAEAVMTMLEARAAELNIGIMSRSSLKTKLSEWENGKSQVSDRYQRLFRDIYGRDGEALGFPAGGSEDSEAAALQNRLIVARSVDTDTVEAFRRQVDAVRYPDAKFGSVTLLDDLRSDVTRIQDLLTFGDGPAHRSLAGVLTEACTLAGWLALDRRAVGEAWRHYEDAKGAARRAESPGLLAHATAEQAFVLIDIGETAAAVEQLARAREIGGGEVAPLLDAWLAAAHGEGFAAAGDRDGALRAFDHADDVLPNNRQDPELPFVILAGTHLDRWRGNALARVGDPGAIEQISAALDLVPDHFQRARVTMLVDLAIAHTAAGDRTAAQYYARQARQLGQQVRTDRQLHRLARLTVPR